MSVLATPRLLVGRKIVAVELRAFEDASEAGRRIKTCYDPVLVLDNGARVFFVVQETETGDSYGIDPRYLKRSK